METFVAGAVPRRLHARGRRAERRVGLHELVREVAAEWIAEDGQPDLQTTLEARLRHLLPGTAVRLKELTGGPPMRVGQPIRAHDYAAFAVPVADPSRRIVLEASFQDASSFDDWSSQLLESAAGLATVLFEAERLTRTRPGGMRNPGDGAAPLIGSSLVMQGLRERVERVATTDFTVLIEGPCGA